MGTRQRSNLLLDLYTKCLGAKYPIYSHLFEIVADLGCCTSKYWLDTWNISVTLLLHLRPTSTLRSGQKIFINSECPTRSETFKMPYDPPYSPAPLPSKIQNRSHLLHFCSSGRCFRLRKPQTSAATEIPRPANIYIIQLYFE